MIPPQDNHPRLYGPFSLRDLDLSCLVALSRREKIRRAAIAISSPPVTKRLNHF